MKKLFAIAIAVSMMSGLYGFTFGLGAAYDGITEAEYFAIRADVTCKPLPILGFRFGIVSVEFWDDPIGTVYGFGTGVGTDVIFFIPMAGMISPYIPFGVWYYGNGVSSFTVKGGLGADFGFGGFAAYLEGGISYMTNGVDMNPIYVQGGIRVPINL